MRLRYDEDRLAFAADAARRFGTPDAAIRLADAVERALRATCVRTDADKLL
nr:hypothetical protein [Kaustia mangrovi]